MEGLPLNSPEPTARPKSYRMELTVPEPSLIAEWNQENISAFHNSNKNIEINTVAETPPRGNQFKENKSGKPFYIRLENTNGFKKKLLYF
jgi:hypothetical protein